MARSSATRQEQRQHLKLLALHFIMGCPYHIIVQRTRMEGFQIFADYKFVALLNRMSESNSLHHHAADQLNFTRYDSFTFSILRLQKGGLTLAKLIRQAARVVALCGFHRFH